MIAYRLIQAEGLVPTIVSLLTPHRSLLLVWRQGRVNTSMSMGK